MYGFLKCLIGYHEEYTEKRGIVIMKRVALLSLLFAFLFLPSHIFAEETHTYLIYADEDQLEEIKVQYGVVKKEFEEIPLVELKLSDSEKADLQQQFSSAEIYPNQQYETAADAVSPSFSLTKSTPKQTSPYTGKGVRVAVLDTGIDTEHPDLKVAGGVCTAAVCASKVPYDDNFGHGTHVAGIIAAQKNDLGIVGMAPNVQLYAIKAMNNRGSGSTAQITKGVEWAIQNDIDILNLSISISVNDRPLELMLQEAYKQGMIIISAAGNEGGSGQMDTMTYPAKYPSVIAVGAVNNDFSREENSSIGPAMELAAPGTEIFSTYPSDLDVWDNKADGYRTLTGTSMAAPHVAGVLALYKEQHPGLSNVKLREMVQSAARDLGTAGRDNVFGFGAVQYEKEITKVPFIQAAINKGGIAFTLKNPQLATASSLKEGETPVAETAANKWETYKTKGTYQFTFSYTDSKGVKKTENLSIKVDEPAFPDVTMSSWFAPYISYLYSNDMMSGYTDGTFKPRKEITRAEALILIGRAQGLDGKARNTVFKDVSVNNAASGYIQSAYEKGILAGFPDGTFRPYQSVTRAEMALLIQSTYKFDYDATAEMPFTDVHAGMASYEAIQAMTQQGITLGISETAFGPSQYMNRYSFSVFLARAENPILFK